mgnify:FL=1
MRSRRLEERLTRYKELFLLIKHLGLFSDFHRSVVSGRFVARYQIVQCYQLLIHNVLLRPIAVAKPSLASPPLPGLRR